MVQLALRQLLLEPLRSGLTIVAVAAVIAVILVVRSFEQGLYAQSRSIVLDRGADLFVSQAGVANFVAVRSSLRQLSRMDVEEVPGVAEAHPVTNLPAIYDQDGRKMPIYLVVYDTLGAPPRLNTGRLPTEEVPEIVIDSALAQKFGVTVGDSLVLSEFSFRVSGIAADSAAFFMPFVFINYDAMLDFIFESEMAPDLSTFPLLSYLLVELEPGAAPKQVAAAIETRVSDVDVFSPAEMAANDEEMNRNMIGPIMGLLIAIAYVVGLLVIGLIVYAEVGSRHRDFGILKALGFRLRDLASTVAIQTLLWLVAAFPVAVFLAWGTAKVIESLAPLYQLPVLDPSGLLRTFAGGVALALLGGMLPLRMIGRVDPMVAFERA